MAITATHLTTDIDDSNLTVYTTASKTPTANRLQIIDVVLSDTNPVLAPSITGCGLTWVLVGGIEYDTAGTRRGVYRFRTLGASPTTGALTITATEAMTSCGWSWAEYDGIDTSGTNGSGAIVQTVTNSGTGTTLSATLAAFGSASNGVSCGLSTDADSVFTAGSGFTILGQDVSASASPVCSIAQQWRADNDTSPDALIGASAQWGLVASELKAAAAAGGTGFPTVTVSLALGAAWNASAPTWTVIPASLVKSISVTTSGRQFDLEQFIGGAGKITFRNNKGEFSPTNTSSPYYPNLHFGTPVKVEATQGGTTYTIWRGYLDELPNTFPNPPNTSEAEWPLIDAFGMFEAKKAEYPWTMFVRAGTPRVWLNFGEVSGTVAIDDSGNGYHGTYHGGPTLQVPFASGIGATFDGLSQDVQLPLAAALTGTGDFAVEFLLDIDVTGTDQLVYSQWDLGASQGLRVFVLATGGVVYMATADGGGITSVIGTTNVTTLPEVHILVRRQGTTHEILVNGVVDGTTVGTVRSLPAGSATVTPVTMTASTQATIDLFATYQQTFTAALALAHFAAVNAYHLSTSGAQVSYILDSLNWPAADRQIDTGQELVLGQFEPSGSALDMLRVDSDSEFGAIYVLPNGNIRFRERHAILKTPYTTSQATFGNTGSSLPAVIRSLKLENARSRVKNDVTLSVSWQVAVGSTAYDVSVHRVDQASSDLYGPSTYSRSVLTATIGGSDGTRLKLLDLADWILAHYRDPIREVRQLELHPHEASTAAMWQNVLGRVQEDRITHTFLTPWGETISGDYHIQRISHTIGEAKTWQTVWSLSPAETQSYWVWDTSTWDTSTRWGV